MNLNDFVYLQILSDEWISLKFIEPLIKLVIFSKIVMIFYHGGRCGWVGLTFLGRFRRVNLWKLCLADASTSRNYWTRFLARIRIGFLFPFLPPTAVEKYPHCNQSNTTSSCTTSYNTNRKRLLRRWRSCSIILCIIWIYIRKRRL